jgi:hypothetical protein
MVAGLRERRAGARVDSSGGAAGSASDARARRAVGLGALGLAMLLPWNVYLSVVGWLHTAFRGHGLLEQYLASANAACYLGSAFATLLVLAASRGSAQGRCCPASRNLERATRSASLTAAVQLCLAGSTALLWDDAGALFAALSCCLVLLGVGAALLQDAAFSLASGPPAPCEARRSALPALADAAGDERGPSETADALGADAHADADTGPLGAHGVETQAVMAGQAVAGVASAVLSLVVGAAFPLTMARGVTVAVLALSAVLVAAALALFLRKESRKGPGNALQLHAQQQQELTRRDDRECVYKAVGGAVDESSKSLELSGLQHDQDAPPLASGGLDVASAEDEDGQSVASASVVSLSSDSGAGREALFGAAVFLCFTLTLGVFPGLTTQVEPKWTNRGAFQSWLVLTFTLGDLAGRFGAGLCPIRSAQHLCAYAALRFGLAPLLMLGDLRGGRLPAVISSDAWPLLVVLVLGVSNGHLATQGMIRGCARYSTEMMNLSMNGGLAAGGLLSNALTALCCTVVEPAP